MTLDQLLHDRVNGFVGRQVIEHDAGGAQLLAEGLEHVRGGTLEPDYTGYRFLPGHYGEFTEIREETDRIISEYETRCTQLRLALAESRRPMTLLELDQALYVQRMQTYRYSYLFSYLNTWPKLFSCLDWLAETGVIRRAEKDGILFWSLR